MEREDVENIMKAKIFEAIGSNTHWVKNWDEEDMILLHGQEEIKEKIQEVEEEEQLPSPEEAGHTTQEGEKQMIEADGGRNLNTSSPEMGISIPAHELSLPTAVKSPACTDFTGVEMVPPVKERKDDEEKLPFWRPWEGEPQLAEGPPLKTERECSGQGQVREMQMECSGQGPVREMLGSIERKPGTDEEEIGSRNFTNNSTKEFSLPLTPPSSLARPDVFLGSQDESGSGVGGLLTVGSGSGRRRDPYSREKRFRNLLSYHKRLVEEKGLPPSRLMMQEVVMHHGQPGRFSVRRKLKFKHQAGAQEHGGGIGSHAGPEGRSQQCLEDGVKGRKLDQGDGTLGLTINSTQSPQSTHQPVYLSVLISLQSRWIGK